MENNLNSLKLESVDEEVTIRLQKSITKRRSTMSKLSSDLLKMMKNPIERDLECPFQLANEKNLKEQSPARITQNDVDKSKSSMTNQNVFAALESMSSDDEIDEFYASSSYAPLQCINACYGESSDDEVKPSELRSNVIDQNALKLHDCDQNLGNIKSGANSLIIDDEKELISQPKLLSKTDPSVVNSLIDEAKEDQVSQLIDVEAKEDQVSQLIDAKDIKSNVPATPQVVKTIKDQEYEMRLEEIKAYRAKAAKIVFEHNMCSSCINDGIIGLSKSKSCKDCISMWRCVFCDVAIKGPYLKIKQHIVHKHFRDVDLSGEEKSHYLKIENLICHWPYKKTCSIIRFDVLA